MTGPDDLDALCERAGVERTYHDQFGVRHDVPPETALAIVEAIGEADERSPLPPAIVWCVEDGAPEVPLFLPAAAGDGLIHWELIEETGARHTGEAAYAALEFEKGDGADGRPIGRRKLRLGAVPSLGYHRLKLDWKSAAPGAAEAEIIVVPRRVYWPPHLESGPGVWGIGVQLYALRSDYDWGIGDFGNLADFVRRAATDGADAVGLNPLHALFLDEPEKASPYAPSSRSFLNPLYIDVEAVPDFVECEAARSAVAMPAFRVELARLRGSPLVDYAGVARQKRAILELLHGSFRRRHLARHTRRGRAFRAFQRREGEALRRFCVFQALRETRGHTDPAQRYWRNWPSAFRNPDSVEVARFADRNRDQVEFFAYLEWTAQEQLAACSAAARDAGMGIGLYRDLAVGVDAGAAEAWSAQDTVVAGWSLGAPPDAWNARGQDWGLAPLNPNALRRSRFHSFVALLRSNMRHAGALRIDHILGWWRAFWIRHGEGPARGAYVRYPFADLVGILALESHRARCLVVGEDLGTVPDGLRDALERAGILSYRLLYFEREADGSFRAPGTYPIASLAGVTTHDLPTLRGYWSGTDIELAARLGFAAEPDRIEAARRLRRSDRAALQAALSRAQIDVAGPPETAPSTAIHRYLARAPSRIVMVQIEDALGISEQVNVPGTVDEYPNWRRRLPIDVEACFAREEPRMLFRAISEERPAPTGRAAMRLGVPLSTYRLQFNARFTLGDAQALVPYLAALGISHVYASPLLRARPGSEHGYDITDHDQINPEIGTWTDFRHFTDALRAHGIGLVLDFVPNHMGIGKADNPWWLDVLEWGQDSIHAEAFDIDWTPFKPELRGKLLLPMLGDHYGTILEAGELVLRFDSETAGFSIWYHEHRLPLRPRSYAAVLRRALAAKEAAPPIADAARNALERIADGFDRIRRAGRARRLAMRRAAESLKAELAALCAADPEVEKFVIRGCAALEGAPGKPETFRALHAILESQHYRLAYWRVAADEINYRRFFNINELAGIRMETRATFDAAHRLVGRMIADGRLQGLRLDHVDGLFDPEAYFRRLRGFAESQSPTAAPETPPFYVVIEKILARHEMLRLNWAVSGTTGYEFAGLVTGLFVAAANEAACTEAYSRFTGRDMPFDDVLLAAKAAVIEAMFAGELSSLSNELDRLSERHWGTRDYTMHRLRAALAAVATHFPVYRTYVSSRRVSAEDRRDLDWAVAQAKKSWRGADTESLDFVHAALTGDLARPGSPYSRPDVLHFAMRFQQFTGPLMAKSMEDTAFYRYHRLIALNEVGGDPRQFGISVAAFHHANRQRARHWPHSMLATSTHDTKRGEDARARIAVISEIPEEWSRRVTRWSELNRSLRRELETIQSPSREDEYLFYQALVGAWPENVAAPWESGAMTDFTTRVAQFMIKSVREARIHTSWDRPNDDYENACADFVRGALDSRRSNPFLAEISAFVERISEFGALNSLSQTVLRLTCPGVADTYQGGETWDFSLVDPDNRRPVNFAERGNLQRDIAGRLGESGQGWADFVQANQPWSPGGKVKFALTLRLLHLRRTCPDLFRGGSYEPLTSAGARGDHVVAFLRRGGGRRLLVLAGRMFVSLLGPEAASYDGEAWGDTRLADEAALDGRWRDVLGGGTLYLRTPDSPSGARLAGLMPQLPLAVLLRERD